ncbi:MAG: hypothetical protein Q4P29_02355 [Tissierellia bacterium]|nr:hypothetical protein [Tissierellia bacterium]
MFKLLKYEHKLSRKFMWILIAVSFFGSLLVQGTAASKEYLRGPEPIVFGVIIVIGTMVTFLFYMVSILRRDLYSDSGYLTFSLPLNGFQTIGAKLMNVVIWATIAVVLNILFIIAFSSIAYSGFWNELTASLKNFLDIFGGKSTILYIILLLVQIFNIYMVLTLALIIGKSIFKNGKMGWLWIIIYFLINYMITKLAPYFLNMETAKYLLWYSSPIFLPGFTPDNAAVIPQLLTFNIAVGAVVYFISSVLWEKCVEI